MSTEDIQALYDEFKANVSSADQAAQAAVVAFGITLESLYEISINFQFFLSVYLSFMFDPQE